MLLSRIRQRPLSRVADPLGTATRRRRDVCAAAGIDRDQPRGLDAARKDSRRWGWLSHVADPGCAGAHRQLSAVLLQMVHEFREGSFNPDPVRHGACCAGRIHPSPSENFLVADPVLRDLGGRAGLLGTGRGEKIQRAGCVSARSRRLASAFGAVTRHHVFLLPGGREFRQI